MAIRLGDYVVYGELYNKKNYSTHGIIALRGEADGEETLIHLDLTGNCGPDLKGKGFRFLPANDDPSAAVFRWEEHPGFQDRQIGPTGDMTAQGWVRAMPCGVEEFLRRAHLGEPPPTSWKRRLYLEWFGQNGRVVIEMADAIVEECVRTPKDDDVEGEWAPLPNLALPPDLSDAQPRVLGPDITIFHNDGDNVHIEHWIPPCESEHPEEGTDALQRGFDAEAAAIDRAIRGEDGSEDAFDREMALFDYCMEESLGQPLISFSDDFDKLPSPDSLDDEAVETQLKLVLARLANFGVALDVCEHFTPRDCYRLLVEQVLAEHMAHRELVGTSWVQHISTYEYCPACEAEFDAEYEASRPHGDEPEGDASLN